MEVLIKQAEGQEVNGVNVESEEGGALFFFECIGNKWLCRHLSL